MTRCLPIFAQSSIELNRLISKLQVFGRELQNAICNNRVLLTVTQLYERDEFIWIRLRLAFLVTFRISRGLFVIFGMKRMNGRRRGQRRGEQGAGNTTVGGIRGPRRIVFSSIPSSRLFHLLPLWALLFLGKSPGFIAFITITTLKQFITSPLPTAPLHLPQHLSTLSFYFRFWRDPFDFSLAWQHEFQP